MFGGGAEMAKKSDFARRSALNRGFAAVHAAICRALPNACGIERKRRLSRGLRGSGESCGALFGRYDLPWWRALTQKYFDGRELCDGLA